MLIKHIFVKLFLFALFLFLFKLAIVVQRGMTEWSRANVNLHTTQPKFGEVSSYDAY